MLRTKDYLNQSDIFSPNQYEINSPDSSLFPIDGSSNKVIPTLYEVTLNENKHPQLPKTWPITSSTWISAQVSDTAIQFIYFCKTFYSNNLQDIYI